MVFLEYKDFDQLYHDFSRYPVYHYDECKNDSFIIGATIYLNNVIIRTTSSDCHLDMSDFNYTIVKWSTLINKYIDKSAYFDLKDRLRESTSKTLTFNFKIHIGRNTDKDTTKNRDSCLVALIFSRNGNSGEWTTVNIYYRVGEVFKKFAIDLILFNRMFKDLPNLNLKEYIFHIPQPFFSTFTLAELIGGNLFKIEEFDIPDNFICFKINKFYNKFYGEGAVESNYHAIARKQKMKKENIVRDPIPIDSLVIFDDPGVEHTLW